MNRCRNGVCFMKKVYTIKGLDCANCAAKLERKMNEIEEVEEAVLTFSTEQLRITAEDPDALLPKLQAVADAMEEGVVIQERVRRGNGRRNHKQHCEGEHHHHHECGCEGKHHHHECDCEEYNPQTCESEHFHAHNRDDAEDKEAIKKSVFLGESKEVVQIVTGAFLFLLGEIFAKTGLPTVVSITVFCFAYLILGFGVLKKAVKNIGKGQIFDENFLMSIATVGALLIQEYPEAVGVMLFYRIGELLEDMAVEKSRNQIIGAVDLRPEMVNVLTDNRTDGDEERVKTIPAEDAKVDDIILVRPGDRIPLDGIVVEGESRLDTSAITGEPVPIHVQKGTAVLSGCVNQSGVLKLKVTKGLEDSMVTRILDSVENAAASKPKMDRFITRFARIYTPFVVALAAATAIVPSLVTGNWSHWIYTALTFLVISCPCALVLSVPLAFFAGIGAGSKLGILFKGGVSLEALDQIKAVVMDKTGTITEGNFKVQSVWTAPDVAKEEVLRFAAGCEAHSTHPIALSILSCVKEQHIEAIAVQELTENAGYGIQGIFENASVLCGNMRLLQKEGIDLTSYIQEKNKDPFSGSEVFVAYHGRLLGCICIADTLKADSKEAITAMKQKKCNHGLVTVMLTGDNEESANAIAKEMGIDIYYAKLLPEDKLQQLLKIREQYGSVLFVGDGINDAPVLAGADVGAAIGSGADAAIEAADVVFMNSSLTSVPEAVKIAKKSCRISKQNVIFALAVKAAVMVLGLCGLASMWMAVFADSGVALLCVFNSVRILKNRRG